MRAKNVFLALVISLVASQINAQDWPRWRGVNQDDKSAATDLLKEWPEGGPEKVWVYEDGGLGYSGFSIVGDKLFTMGLEDGTEFALCLNANTGEKIWQADLGGQFNNKWGDGPRSTPAVDGDRVYFMAAKGSLTCLSVEDGSRKWQASMTELGGKVPIWGYAESPLVSGDMVYCTPGGSGGSLAAFDKMSGELKWQSKDVTSPAHYSTILDADHNGQPQLIQLLVDKVVGVSPSNGELLWETDWPGRVAVIPSPIYNDGKVYVTTGYAVGCKLIDLGENKPVDVYYNKNMTNHHGGVVLLDGHVYGYSDGKGFVCQNLESGEMVWNNKSRKDFAKGALSYADGLFYLIEERSGIVRLFSANPEGHEEFGKFTLDPQTQRRKPDGKIWVHPVIANGKLYLRDQEFIHCYDISAK